MGTISSFWIAWISIWLCIFSIMFASLIGFSCAAREQVNRYINGTPIPSPTAAAVNISSHMADFIFGNRLFYFFGFIRSVFFSVIIGIIFFIVAYVTTPGLSGIKNYFLSPLENGLDIKSILSMSPVLTLILSFISMLFEYVYVAKSRWILRNIKYYTTIYKVIFIWSLDIISTIGLFIIITPIILIIVSKSLDLFINDIQGKLIEIEFTYSYSDTDPIIFSDNTLVLYEHTTKGLYHDVISHIESGLTQYSVIKIRRQLKEELDKECSDYNKLLFYQINRECHITFVGMAYLTTTMLATAFGTNIWVTICAIILISYRIIGNSIYGARRLFIWVYDNPNTLIFCCLMCWPICFISGWIITNFG